MCIMQENLQQWMMDKRGRDQFVIRYGDETEIGWNDAQRSTTEQARHLAFYPKLSCCSTHCVTARRLQKLIVSTLFDAGIPADVLDRVLCAVVPPRLLPGNASQAGRSHLGRQLLRSHSQIQSPGGEFPTVRSSTMSSLPCLPCTCFSAFHWKTHACAGLPGI